MMVPGVTLPVWLPGNQNNSAFQSLEAQKRENKEEDANSSVGYMFTGQKKTLSHCEDVNEIRV